jgi:2-phospho-L-lactate guanylyltransferase
MFRKVAATLAACERLAGWAVVTRDARVAAVARGYGAVVIPEQGVGLNSAVAHGCRVVRSRGADSALIIPSDLPLLAPQDIDELVILGSALERGVVMAPSWQGEGTNALYMKPPGVIAPSFGPGSFARHMDAARMAGVSTVCYPNLRIAMDVDMPEDLWLTGLARTGGEGRWVP